ncbi:unnamed protein product [Polarella glacialis]|uniref:Enoyl reductase (ER) domain-containing protein n=1 Tax=Polarella glacialis TaxID=89957 RepID=A0A813E5P0_POLGL|nr:unnamed protein product [Polarella glacialis]
MSTMSTPAGVAMMSGLVYTPGGRGGFDWAASSLPVPVVKKGSKKVLVKVLAVGLNAADVRLTQMPYVARFAAKGVVGMDFVGKVMNAPVGSTFKDGDVVFGTSSSMLADYALCDDGSDPKAPVMVLPALVSVEQAAGLSMAGTTALKGLRLACTKGSPEEQGLAGNRVLVLGASGGVGVFGVQIAKLMGASFVAGVCSGANGEMVRGLGCDEVWDYKAPGFEFPTEEDALFDVILDTASSMFPGDVDYYPRAIKSLKPGSGQYVAVGSGLWSDIFKMVASVMLPHWLSPQKKQFLAFVSSENRPDLDTLAGWVASGRLVVPVGSVMPFAEEPCKEALAVVESRRTKGKLVIRMQD